MFQQLATETGAQGWAITSMLFFLAVFGVVVFRLIKGQQSEYQAYASLPLEGDEMDNDPSGVS